MYTVQPFRWNLQHIFASEGRRLMTRPRVLKGSPSKRFGKQPQGAERGSKASARTHQEISTHELHLRPGMVCFLHEVSNVAVVRATYFMSMSLAPANSPWTTTLHHTRYCSSSLASDRHLLWLKLWQWLTRGGRYEDLRRIMEVSSESNPSNYILWFYKSLKYRYYQTISHDPQSCNMCLTCTSLDFHANVFPTFVQIK